MNIPAITKKHLLFALVLLLAFVVRALLIIYAQTNGGDWLTYERFADNILHGNGFSLSDPASSVIVPSSGGYYPGFPAFIALVWLLFGKSVMAVLWAQLVLYILALYWLLTSLLKLTNNIHLVTGAGLLLALSPLTAGWSRFPLTESLAITASMWFLAEIINSLAVKKLRVLPLAAALAASIYIRPDTVLMAIAVFPVSTYLYERKRDVFKQIVIFILLTSVPVTAWMVRDVLIGRAPISMHEGEGRFLRQGYFAWVNTWAVNEYERADALFYDPEHTQFHPSKFRTEAESKTAYELLAQLSSDESKIMSEPVDNRFQELANEKSAKTGVLTKAELFIKKSYNLLLNPFSSWGLPLEVGYDFDRSAALKAIKSADFAHLSALVATNKSVVIGKLLLFLYRLILFPSFFMLFFSVVRKTLINKVFTPCIFDLNILVSASFMVMFSRLFFFVFLGGLESRYIVEVIPWVECLLFWFSVNWRIQMFELVYKHGGIHHAQATEKLPGSGQSIHSQKAPC